MAHQAETGSLPGHKRNLEEKRPNLDIALNFDWLYQRIFKI